MSIISHKLRRGQTEVLPVEVNFLTSGADLSDTDSYTISSVNIGSANTTRQIFVTANFSGAFNGIDSATIGGVSATLATQDTGFTVGRRCFFAEVPTGTTADIVVNLSGTSGYLLYGIYSVINRVSTSADTDSDLGAATGYSTPLTVSSVTVNSGGFAIAGYGGNEDKTFSSSPYTLDGYTTAGSAENIYLVSASYVNTGATTTPTQSLSWTPTDTTGIGWGIWAFAR